MQTLAHLNNAIQRHVELNRTLNLIIGFDEIHELEDPLSSRRQLSRAFRYIERLWVELGKSNPWFKSNWRINFPTLSTNSYLEKFVQERLLPPSARLEGSVALPPPFIAFPSDIPRLSNERHFAKRVLLKDMPAYKNICKLGRPLYHFDNLFP